MRLRIVRGIEGWRGDRATSGRRAALAIARAVAPKRVWFTHISHDLPHEETNARLPENVRMGYDGLSFEVSLA